MRNFKKEYRDLEMCIYSTLRDLIEKKGTESKHINEKAIKVNLFDYEELSIVNDRLFFLDSNGDHHSVDADATLEDLIDILNANPITNIWAEIRTYNDEFDDVTHVDAWVTADDNEGGTIIATIDNTTKEVKYFDERAKTDSIAQEIINEVLTELA